MLEKFLDLIIDLVFFTIWKFLIKPFEGRLDIDLHALGLMEML
jgi:hypothetical protein